MLEKLKLNEKGREGEVIIRGTVQKIRGIRTEMKEMEK